VDEEFFSNITIFGAGKTTFTGLSAAVDTLLAPSTEVLGTRKPHNEARCLQTLAVSSPFWSAFFSVGLCSSSFILGRLAPAGWSTLAALLINTFGLNRKGTYGSY